MPRKNNEMKNRWMNTYVMYIWIYFTFTRIFFQRFIEGQQGPHFAMIKLTWENAYDYCALRGQRLVYSIDDFSDFKEVLAESNISLLNIWTIHKVYNETPKATRSNKNFTTTIGYNLSDLESVLCVYLVYEDLMFKGWEADECKNETVVHYPLCDDSVHASLEITLYQEKVDWREAKSYCEHKSSALIYLDSGFLYGTFFGSSMLELNLTSPVTFWVEPLKYPDAVVEETMCDYGVIHPPPIGLFIIETKREFCTKPLHDIMCEKRTENIYFLQVTYHFPDNLLLLKSMIASRPVECEEQCIAIIKYGIDCSGFNFNWTSQECLFLTEPYEFYLNEVRNPDDFVSYEYMGYEITDEMVGFMVKYGKVTIGEYKPMNEDESTEFQIQNHYNTDTMFTDQQSSTVGKTITKTKPTSTGGNAEGRLLTITMGVVGTVASFILMFEVVSIVHKVQYMESSLAGEKKTRKESEEQLMDSFTIELSDDDGERILTKGVDTRNIPPMFYMDIIE